MRVLATLLCLLFVINVSSLPVALISEKTDTSKTGLKKALISQKAHTSRETLLLAAATDLKTDMVAVIRGRVQKLISRKKAHTSNAELRKGTVALISKKAHTSKATGKLAMTFVLASVNELETDMNAVIDRHVQKLISMEKAAGHNELETSNTVIAAASELKADMKTYLDKEKADATELEITPAVLLAAATELETHTKAIIDKGVQKIIFPHIKA